MEVVIVEAVVILVVAVVAVVVKSPSHLKNVISFFCCWKIYGYGMQQNIILRITFFFANLILQLRYHH